MPVAKPQPPASRAAPAGKPRRRARGKESTMHDERHGASESGPRDNPAAGVRGSGSQGDRPEEPEQTAERLPSFTPMEDSDDPDFARKAPGFTPQGRTDSSDDRPG